MLGTGMSWRRTKKPVVVRLSDWVKRRSTPSSYWSAQMRARFGRERRVEVGRVVAEDHVHAGGQGEARPERAGQVVTQEEALVAEHAAVGPELHAGHAVAVRRRGARGPLPRRGDRAQHHPV